MSDEFPNVDVSNGGDATNTCTPTTCVSLLPERWYWALAAVVIAAFACGWHPWEMLP